MKTAAPLLLLATLLAACGPAASHSGPVRIVDTVGVVVAEDSFFGATGKKVDLAPLVPFLKTGSLTRGISVRKGYYTIRMNDGTTIRIGQFSASFEIEGIVGVFTVPENQALEFFNARDSILRQK